MELKISPHKLYDVMTTVLTRLGVGNDEAKTVATVLIASDRRGIPSHGFARFKGFYVDRIKAGLIDPKAKPEIVRNVKGTAVVDANNGLGHPTGAFAMKLAIAKAKEHGIGMVAVRNSNHYGIAGYYAQMGLAENIIGLTGTNARPAVAPTHGVEAMFGTNPFAIAMPSDDEYPFVFDAATSIAQRGKVETYARRGKTLREGWVIGADGKSKTSPAEVLSALLNNTAALLPLGGQLEESGGHKGFGFAMVVELLSSVLQQGANLRETSGVGPDGKPRASRIGHFFAAIDANCFVEPAVLRASVGQILRDLRASRRAHPDTEILTAGMPEIRNERRIDEEGVFLDEEMARDLESLTREFNLQPLT